MPDTIDMLSRRSLLQGLATMPALAGLAGFAGTAVFSTVTEAQGTKVVTIVGQIESSHLLSLVSTNALMWSPRVAEGLLEFDFDMNPQPLLATSWDISADGLTYTFQLRKGVKWHDGENFTSEDVKFSMLTQKKYHPRARTTFASVDTIETPDEHTVVLKLTKPTAYLLKSLSSMESPIAPHHVYKEGDDPLTHPNNFAPIGTGAYVFKEWVRGSHAVWEKNPNYWNPDLPVVDRLVGRFIADASARAIAFETGDVDVGYRTPVTLRDLERLKKMQHLDFTDRGYAYDPPNIIMLEAHLRDPALGKLEVRQAIAHCLDREQINKVVFYNYATPSAAPVVPFHKDFHLGEPTPYEFNLEKAAELLDKAGYPMKDGKRMTLTVEYVGDTLKVLGEYLRSVMGQIGIVLELRGQDYGSIIKRVYTDQDYQLHLATLSNLFDPQVGVQRLYWSKNILKGVGFTNGTGYSDPEVDVWLESAQSSTDHKERVELWHRVQRKVLKDVPNFPLLMDAWQTVSNKRIADHTTNAEGIEGSMSRVKVVG